VLVPATPLHGATEGDGPQRGWELAQWAVAHARELRVEQVSFDGMRWQAARSGRGWQKQTSGSSSQSGTSGAGSGSGKGKSPHGGSADGFVRITVAR